MKLIIIVSLLSVALAFPREENAQLEDEPFEEELIMGEDRVERSAAIPGDKYLWPNGIIYYAIDHTAEHLRSLITAAIQHIQQRTCIRFRENYGGDRIYITSKEGSCTSPVGRRGGQQNLNLGKGCRAFGIILHQLLHAIGMLHEHTRSDRDKYVNVLWENVKPGSQDLFVQLATNKNRLLSPFDYYSVMMFGEYDYTREPGLRTLAPLQPGVKLIPLREKKGLSPVDSAKIRQLYKCEEP